MRENRNNEDRDPFLDGLIAELPREHEPQDLLEERTVRAVRAAGAIAGPPAARRVPRAWLVGATAASIALFASGLALGQWLGSRQAVALAQAHEVTDYTEAAAHIEQAGEAYVRALSQLVEQGGERGSAQALFARETAISVLHQAANEVVRLAPNDPVAAKILQGLDQAESMDAARERARQPARRVLWF